MKLLKVLRSLLSKKDETIPASAPVVEVAAVEPRTPVPEPTEPEAPREPLKVSLPRLADAIPTKSVGKRQAFALVKAQYGPDGVTALRECIAEARKRWLPIPGTIRKTSDGREHAVDKNGAIRRVSRLVAAAQRVAA
jgi:hypothetical protein